MIEIVAKRLNKIKRKEKQKELIEKMREIVKKEEAFLDVCDKYNVDVNFIDEGYLDSFDLITIVSDLESTFDIKINGSLIVPESFSSLDSIVKLVQSSKNAS